MDIFFFKLNRLKSLSIWMVLNNIRKFWKCYFLPVYALVDAILLFNTVYCIEQCCILVLIDVFRKLTKYMCIKQCHILALIYASINQQSMRVLNNVVYLY